MQLRDTPEEAAFRAEVRAWLEEHNPGFDGLADIDAQESLEPQDLRRRLRGADVAEGVRRPGRPYSHQAIVLEEWARAEAPGHLGVIGLGMAGPTIIAHGTEEQKQRYLANILSAEEIWCQGFSEPDAGSDLSAVRTSAELRDGHFVVNGQKVWSSYAHIADWCILVTRSRPRVPAARRPHVHGRRHALAGRRGRPLRHITGEAEFNEIFFENVEVPVENVLDEVGNGWAVAMTTLLHERGTLGFALTGALEVLVSKLDRRWRRSASSRTTAPRQGRARVDRAPGAQAHELPGADEARRDGHPRPGGLRLEAPVVGGEPAARQARARDPGR